MIHQLIFANPKPGMSVKEFQDYWVNVHAVQYARKISQIKKYKVNRILAIPGEDGPIFNGVAEIWLENEQEQLASLESDAFIKGARTDEPNWAAFWQTVSLDTYSYDKILDDRDPEYKLLFLMKRKEGIPLDIFRKYLSDSIIKQFEEINDIRQLTLSIVKDSFYEIGEAPFDAALHIWLEDYRTAAMILKDANFQTVYTELKKAVNSRYLYKLLCQENRIF
ncbi:MAG TPA: ethyl tert-butyl ether degradation protein EthD [Lachnospiraceae bacterium]|nr:ethyl tert-butyl ether degradation protein EthD [Lachnospiraceae bacterium]